MTVTLSDPVWLDDQTLVQAWTSSISGATFYIYRDREFLTATRAGSMQFRVVPGEYLLIDVFDSSGDSPDYAAPGRVYLCWFEVSGSASYLVQERVGAYWQDRESVPDDGDGFFRYLTRYLEDATTTEFRVLPVDSAGNQGTSTLFTVVQVRHPEIPDVAYAYDSATATVAIDTIEVSEGREEDMPESYETYEASGAGAMAETLSAAGTKRKILEVRVTLADGSTVDMSGIQVFLDPPTGQVLPTPIYESNATETTALASVDAFVKRFAQPVAIADDQDVRVVWANATSATWELQLAYIDDID